MFGRKKNEERPLRDRDSRVQEQWSNLDRQEGPVKGGYYRQDDYYTQQPEGPENYYRQQNTTRPYSRPENYDYSRPAEDARFDARVRGDYRQEYTPPQSAYDRERMERRRQAHIERTERVGKTAGGETGYRGTAGGGRGRGPEQPYYSRPKRKRRWWLFILELLLILLLALGVFAFANLSRMDRTKLKELVINTGVPQKSGYLTVVLYGVDSRSGQLTSDCNSDTIIICTLNRQTKEVRMASVYRDTYLDNTDGSYRKATDCYAYGGPQLSISMLNKNLDLNIKDYVAVNFNAVIQVIDLLGGIDLEITEEERQYINGYCVETSQVTGVQYEDLPYAGLVHLDGIHAMAYCRIRYTEGWDFKRTERQRTVLTLAYQKALQQGPAALLSIANAMLPQISTSMGNLEIIELITGMSSYKLGSQTGFPFDQAAADTAAGDCVVPVNLAANVTKLHEFLYDETDYAPSDTVQTISSEIANATGIY